MKKEYYGVFSNFLKFPLSNCSKVGRLFFLIILFTTVSGIFSTQAQLPCNTTSFPDDWGVKQLENSSLPHRSVYTFPEHDLDGDGLKDIVTGGWWYKNPGSVAGTWVRSNIGSSFNNVALVHDFDGDGDMDLLGTTGAYTGSDLVWAQNNGTGGFNIFFNIPSGNTNYSEPFLAGIAGGVFQSGGSYQMAINWNGAESTNSPMQMLTPTANPTQGTWVLIDIPNAVSTGEDLQVGDIDSDGDLDLFQGVNWIRNNGASGWQTISTGISYVTTPDRAQLADFDRDGDLDAVVGQLGVGAGTNPLSYRFSWFEAPSDPTQAWIEHVLDTDVRGSLSVTASDIDFDGDKDIVVGEWLGQHRLLVFENKLCVDGTFSKRTINAGDPSKEHHDGARVTDIDNDGDLDVISNGWVNNFPRIYENQSVPGTNELPIVNAGSDQNITLATVTLNGSASDPDGGNITAFLWTQQSGPNTANLSGATSSNLTATNLVDGTYVFRLTATDDENSTNFDDAIITVSQPAANQKPVAVAASNIGIGNAPLSILFTGSNSTDDLEVVSYLWNFGDGTSASEADPTKTFTTVGVFTVQLTVTDGRGLTDSDTLTVTVTDEPIVNAGLDQNINAATVTVNGSANDPDGGNITSYLWTQQSGPNTATFSGETTETLTATSLVEGTYVFRLTATDDENDTNFDEVSISVSLEPETNEAPVAIAEANILIGNTPLVVMFTGSNSTDDAAVISYIWDFGDGTSATEADPDKTFTTVGVFTVLLTVTDGGGLSNVATLTITVTDEPIVNAGSDQTITSETVTLNGTASDPDGGNIASVLWTQQSGPNTAILSGEITETLTVTNLVEGAYVFRLIATDDEGDTNFDEATISVSPEAETNEAPVAIVEASTVTGDAPLSVMFKGSNSTDDVEVISYLWDFGDGTSATEADPVKTFTTVRVFTVQLTVTDGSGLTNSTTLTITVNEANTESQEPVAIIEADILSGNASLEVNFTGANSTNDIASYLWDFGDGTSSTEANPTKEFMNPGEYIVQLIVTNSSGETNSISLTITVLPNIGEMQVILESNPPSLSDKGVATILIFNKPSETSIRGVTLHDVGGRYIAGYTQNEITETSTFKLPVSTLRDGLYFVKVELSTGKSTLMKLWVRN